MKADAWLPSQAWQRDLPNPCLSLGSPGAFDDTHIHAPCVLHEAGQYRMWYTGARGEPHAKVYALGLATSDDGIHFTKHAGSPVFELGDGRHSVLTPRVLRDGDSLRMWFSAADYTVPDGAHALHETTSRDGLSWSPPSKPLLEGVYAPSLIKEGYTYRMWFTDVSRSEWVIRYAHSRDGHAWETHPEPALVVDQPWEQGRLFYPSVVKAGDVYVMWYGSYWRQPSGQWEKTALGVAVSEDGLHWRKSPHNPVFRPDPAREWESHYTTSQTVLQLPDGSWRIWYATRPAPPFVHKYFAIGTARWNGPTA